MALRRPSGSRSGYAKCPKLNLMEMEDRAHVHPGVLIDDLESCFSVPHFLHVLAECRKTLASLPESDNSPMAEAKRRIILHVDRQLRKVIGSADLENDFLATILRNLMELRDWARFVASDEEQAERFVNESVIDVRELFELISVASDPEIDAIRAAASHIQGKRKTFDRDSEQDKFFWKLCSKLIHPSSLVINNAGILLQDPNIQKRLAVRIALLGWLIVGGHLNNVQFTDCSD